MVLIMIKLLIYIGVFILVMWSMDAVNINAIFKKNQILKAKAFYFILMLSIVYLLTNFIYDFIYLKIF